MPDPVRSALAAALDGRDLSEAEAAAAIGEVMDGTADEVAVAGLLTALRMKGETADELAGAARAMRQRACRIPVPVGPGGLLDTCGTGGDGLATFNISTAAAIVAAAAGVPVAKHGNRAASSTTGSADVLEALGVNINLSPDQVAACVEQAGIGFCFAPLCHAAMKNVGPVRKRLGFRTIFNLLGPLTNPAGASHQLVGAGRTATAEKLANALARFDVTRAVVVCGNDELDEVSPWGTTVLFVVEVGRVARTTWDAGRASDGPVTAADLRAAGPAESAAMIRGVLAGDRGPARVTVLVNTAAALFAAGRAASPDEGVARAAAAIDSGTAAGTLEKLAAVSNRLAAAE